MGRVVADGRAVLPLPVGRELLPFTVGLEVAPEPAPVFLGVVLLGSR